ncbi:hypothetical protein MKW98_025415 [Papaver atlanticum]|uniref:Uncharacterized protein n=1 Tax=Papaver atlanticum TaxID=357466 RepID=A0AAD4SCS1_9MAGN|nr:hypothetical protein MKW98_025415 [Papaver atlanticum]
MPEFLMHIILILTDMLSLIGFRDLVQNQLTGDIPRLIYWDEVLQYLCLTGNSLTGTYLLICVIDRTLVFKLKHLRLHHMNTLRNKAAAMKSNPIGAAADFDEDGKLNLSSWKEQS